MPGTACKLWKPVRIRQPRAKQALFAPAGHPVIQIAYELSFSFRGLFVGLLFLGVRFTILRHDAKFAYRSESLLRSAVSEDFASKCPAPLLSMEFQPFPGVLP